MSEEKVNLDTDCTMQEQPVLILCDPNKTFLDCVEACLADDTGFYRIVRCPTANTAYTNACLYRHTLALLIDSEMQDASKDVFQIIKLVLERQPQCKVYLLLDGFLYQTSEDHERFCIKHQAAIREIITQHAGALHLAIKPFGFIEELKLIQSEAASRAKQIVFGRDRR